LRSDGHTKSGVNWVRKDKTACRDLIHIASRDASNLGSTVNRAAAEDVVCRLAFGGS
jgi:hypothetical protein